jgi:hypothetical protein
MAFSISASANRSNVTVTGDAGDSTGLDQRVEMIRALIKDLSVGKDKITCQ